MESRRIKSRTMMKMSGARTSPCKMLRLVRNSRVAPSGVNTFAFVFV